MELNLSEIASLAEIIGAVAIFVSLIFVGVQLRENTRATRSATASAAIAATSAWYTALGNCEQSSALFWNFMADPDALTPEQRFQIIMNFHAAILISQNSYFLAKKVLSIPRYKNQLQRV